MARSSFWCIRPFAVSTASTPLLSPELLAQLESLELVSRKIFRGRMKGERRSKRKGQSVEFEPLKALAPKQNEPPFLVAQLIVLAIFLGLGALAFKRFRG